MQSDSANDHWSKFWTGRDVDSRMRNDQVEVLRVRNGQPIAQDQWIFTVSHVAAQLALDPGDSLLDLCCGNGLFCDAFSSTVSRISAVDISENLVERLRERNLPNVDVFAMDINKIEFPAGSFTKILWYAGIQYLSEPQIIDMMSKIRRWLKPGGRLLIGDIPDRKKIWAYFNTSERRHAYFDNLKQGTPIIGTWLDPEWLTQLCLYAGFSEAAAKPQHHELIYADFRFDLIGAA